MPGVVNNVWYLHKVVRVNPLNPKRNQIELNQIELFKYAPLILDKSQNLLKRGSRSLKQLFWSNFIDKNPWTSTLISYLIQKLAKKKKRIVDFSVEHKRCNFWGKRTENHLWEIRLGKEFLILASKAKINK